MARGWESKSVESQIDSAEAARGRPPAASLADVELTRKREGLLLSRARVLHDLDACRNERYRVMLLNALAWLDEKLKNAG